MKQKEINHKQNIMPNKKEINKLKDFSTNYNPTQTNAITEKQGKKSTEIAILANPLQSERKEDALALLGHN
uniref:Uncharacterized protein n=1 Tax=Dracunculus medinensis TaxID=318479 RepID=A0A0N4UE50_DRAME